MHGGSAWYDEEGEDEGLGTTLQGLELAAMLEEKRRMTAVSTGGMSPPPQQPPQQPQQPQQQPRPQPQQQQQQQPQQQQQQQQQLQQQQQQQQQQPPSETAALLEMAARVTVTGAEGLDRLAQKMQLVADGLEYYINEQLDKQARAMEELTRLEPLLEHQTDKVKALRAASSLHQELELAQRIERTIQDHAVADPLRDVLT